MSGDKFRRLMEETARRLAQQESRDFLRNAFPEQRAFLEDPDPFKAAHCSRGASKSYTSGLGIYEVMEKRPGHHSVYCTKTHDMARTIMWGPVMKEIDRDFNVGMTFNEGLLEGRHPNGSTFRLMGIDGDRKQQDKLLGGKPVLVVLDEVAFFDTDLTSIVYRTLIPAFARVGGQIWMLSTSSDVTAGLFYEATRPEVELRTRGWSVHEWDWWDNPYVRDEMEKMRQKLIRDNPLIVETSHYKQHWLNQWVIDDDKKCYKFNPARNLIKLEDFQKIYRSFPPGGWSRVLGVDTGWEDDNAFVLSAYHENHPNLYIVKTKKKKKLTFDQVVEEIQLLERDPEWSPHRVVIDGANKQGVESMRARSGIAFEYADKQDKPTFIELANADLVTGRILVVDTPENVGLTSEMSKLVWKTKNGLIEFPKTEHPLLPNHGCDAFLYGWRMGYHYHHTPQEKKTVRYSKEWYAEQAVGIWEKERERLMAGAGGGEEWPEQAPWPE